MSRFQQIRVLVRPEYQKDMAHDFPCIYKQLRKLDNSLGGQNPALIDLVPMLVRLSLSGDSDSDVREIVNEYVGDLENLERQVQNNIAEWQLGSAEKHLNDMDDLFAQLEARLCRG